MLRFEPEPGAVSWKVFGLYLGTVLFGTGAPYWCMLAYPEQGRAIQVHAVQAPQRPVAALPDIQAQMLAIHNKERGTAKLGPLAANERLQGLAQTHAEWMAKNETMSHTAYGGMTFGKRLDASGYPYAAAGENIASGYTRAASCFQAWMDSPGHRTNVLGEYADAGIGFARSRGGRFYWCAAYGAQRGSRRQAAANEDRPLLLSPGLSLVHE